MSKFTPATNPSADQLAEQAIARACALRYVSVLDDVSEQSMLMKRVGDALSVIQRLTVPEGRDSLPQARLVPEELGALFGILGDELLRGVQKIDAVLSRAGEIGRNAA